ncbi:LOG family protein [bacterium]|nr:LOG family protein [bacterium]
MKDNKLRIFPSADEDARSADSIVDTPQTISPSYRLAFRDPDFLLKNQLRPVRLQVELLKPELVFQEKGIESTIVVFGSGRIPEPEIARIQLENVEATSKEACDDPLIKQKIGIAKRMVEKSKYYEDARQFSRIVSLASKNHDSLQCIIITGGGRGIMEAANRGACDAGASSIGLNIVLPAEQIPNPYITPDLCFQFHYFALRKMHFLMRAKALVIFPGGFGTLDELFDAVTLIQTKKINPIPVLLFGREYWERVINFEFMAEEGVIAYEDIKIIQYVETAQEAWDVIKDFYNNNGNNNNNNNHNNNNNNK